MEKLLNSSSLHNKSLPPAQMENILGMRDFVQTAVNQYLKPVKECWQASDYLPDFSSHASAEELRELQTESKRIPDDLLVVLIGDMITEEALPSYQTWVNGLDGIKDDSGAGLNPWAIWTRGWTAEENRHGDLLHKYLYLTGRVNMRAVEISIQYLLRNGFDPETENDPYRGFVYTSFQERATNISHRNAAILASRAGIKKLQDICGTIAGDEARHEKFYQACMKKIFEIDPNGAAIAFARMMKKRIVMPARLMDEDGSEKLFLEFSEIAQRIGVYNAQDYLSILNHLLQIWNVSKLSGLSSDAAKAQEYLCRLPKLYSRIAEHRTLSKAKKKFSWIYDREI